MESITYHGEKKLINGKTKFFNSKTDKWVVKLRESKTGLFIGNGIGKAIGKGKGKSIGKFKGKSYKYKIQHEPEMLKRHYSFTIWLPGKCNDEFLNQYKDKFYKKNISHVELALSLILYNKSCIIHKNKKKSWKYILAVEENKVCIKSSYIKSYLGREYKNVLRRLVELDFIEISDNYNPGIASKQYKIKDWLFDGDYIKKESNDERLKWKQYTQSKNVIFKHNDLTRIKLVEYVEKLMPYIGFDRIQDYLDTPEKVYVCLNYRCKTKAEFEEKYNSISNEELEKLKIKFNKRKYTFADFKMQMSSTKSYNTKDNFGYRFHSPLTNKCSIIKDFIDLEMSEIDIKNSQMFFFINVLENTESVIKLLPEFEQEIRMIAKYNQYDDVKQFIQLVKEGKIYEYIANNILHTTDRNKGKYMAFFCLFSDYSWTRRIPNKQAMQKCFPNLIKLCDTMNGNNMKLIPKIMQRLESHLMIDMICPKLFELEHLATIHDSFLILKQDKDFVKSIIINTFVENKLIIPILK